MTHEITAELTEAICAQIRLGVPITSACANAGISRTSFYRWIERAEDEDAAPEYREFRDAVERARAAKIERCLTLIEEFARIPSQTTGLCDWKALAWILERTEPEHFGVKTKIDAEVRVDAQDKRAAVSELVDRLAARIASEGDEGQDPPLALEPGA